MVIAFYVRLILSAAVIALVAIIVITAIRKKFNMLTYLLPIFVILILYWDLIGERRKALDELTPGVESPASALTLFILEYGRFPISISEMRANAHVNERLNTQQRYSKLYALLFWSPLELIKNPEFGIKTYIEDTLVHTVLYSYGFDNDNDSLQIKVFDFYKYLTQNTNEGVSYILIPLPLNGDVEIEHVIAPVNPQRKLGSLITQWPEGFIESLE